MMKLKPQPVGFQPFHGRSDKILKTDVPVSSDAREWYLKNPSSVSPPCISSSDFVPKVMIEHLMRKKKDLALGVKFVAKQTPPDQITNMEGAMHTFVTPLVLAFIHGDYIYKGGHGMIKFPADEGMLLARKVVISCQIQPDFEGLRIMAALARLEDKPFQGTSLPEDFAILKVAAKQESSKRAEYNMSLRRHMVRHLTQKRCLPDSNVTSYSALDMIGILEDFIRSPRPFPMHSIVEKHIRIPSGFTLSLELLFNTALHQLRNELSALEVLCPQGYVYTSDPPSIFARELRAEVLNRLQFAALKCLAAENVFRNMRAFAFNGYSDRTAISLIKEALANHPSILVVDKSAFFKGPGGTYLALPGTEGALLVLHNNSDAFGQNIEREWESGSMDGAIGSNSSAAASLKRDLKGLVSIQM